MAMQLTTLSGTSVSIADEQVEELRMAFRGPLLLSQDPGYDEARVVQNRMINRRPGLIARCSGTADVIDAVNLAREHQLLTAVRGGGHSIAGHCTCDGGLLIDLSPMRGVWVDAGARVVRVQGGATWGDVDRETQAFGLAVPGGVVSTTGVAGLTLGGGIGWLHRKYGLACDNLRGVEIVTADGKLTRANKSENDELFWGLRGGGGNFGVVTALEFNAFPIGPIVMFAGPMYAIADKDAVFRAWRDWTATVADEVTSRVVFWTMPESPLLPPAVHNQQVLIVGAVYAGPPDEGEKILQPAREFATPLADLSGLVPYRAVQALFDPFFPKGEIASYWKSSYLRALSDDAIDLIARRGAQRPTPLTLVHVPSMGGAVSRPDGGDTAIGDRGAPYMLSVDGNWVEPGDADATIAWVREAIDEAEPFSTGGTFLNFSPGEETGEADLVKSAFGPNLERLRHLKREYDPTNLFRLNNNIVP